MLHVLAVVKVTKKRYEKKRGGGVKKCPENKKLLCNVQIRHAGK